MDTNSLMEISQTLDNFVQSNQEYDKSMKNGTMSKLLNPFEDLPMWGKIRVIDNDKCSGIPTELLRQSDQPALINFKAVMHNLQKTIAIEHAKKVREGKESVNMNGLLRQKYSEDNYYFPDRILNSGLQKKDFTAPFLIDVKLINQDLGTSAAGKENEKKSRINVVTKIEPQSIVANEESQKRKQSADPILSSPTLYAMLEQPVTKRLKVGENTTFVVPPAQQIASQQQQGNQNQRAHPVPMSVQSQSPAVTLSKVTRSNMPTLSPNPPVATRNAITLVELPRPPIPVTRQPTLSKTPPDTSHFVSIRPKLPASVTAQEKIVPKSTPPVVNLKSTALFQNSEKDPDDDFSPKIINTQGSVVMVKGSPDKHVQMNGNGIGVSAVHSPQVTKVPQRNGSDSVTVNARRSNADAGMTIQGSGFLGCKLCGKTFPSNCDNLFRSHMIIKHSKEVSDTDIFEAKIVVKSWFKCKKCKLMVLNNLEDHHKRCSPEVSYSNAFEAIRVNTDDAPKLSCGLCPETFESRVHLRAHLVEKHPEINNKVLLDPYYRCGICLLRFKDSSQKLIEHVTKCKAASPSLETAQEIAQLNLECEICNKKHSKIRETLFCYQVKTLLRCVLCLHVSISRTNFFHHLKVHHNRRGVGICCPFCNDNVEKPTRQAFDHFIDQHYNVALKRAGEAALVRGRIQLKAQAAASKMQVPHNNSFHGGSGMPKLTRPVMQSRKSMPTLRPKNFCPPSPQIHTFAGNGPRQVISTATRVPVPLSQVLQMPGSAHTFPPGTVVSLARFVSNAGGVSQLPIGLTFVPAQTIQTLSTASAVDPNDASAEDSILGSDSPN